MELIGGLDEVGRGALAGPMVVAVTAFEDCTTPIHGVQDSKKLKAGIRQELAPSIVQTCNWFGVGWAEPWEIDDLGMTAAWQLACRRALEGAPPLFLLVDGNVMVDCWDDQEVVVKGDEKEWQIGAASIVAKVMRDDEMVYQSLHHPGYGWEKNVGYGTEQHFLAIKELGPSREHRQLFLRKHRKRLNIQ